MPPREPLFSVVARDPQSRARAGMLRTAHGIIETPALFAVATKASIKALPVWLWEAAGVQAVVVNTYHLLLAPGADRVASLGGVHQFAQIPTPVFSDSGGFQAFSLGVAFGRSVSKVVRSQEAADGSRASSSAQNGALSRITNDGVQFRSHRDGSVHLLTPEASIRVQHLLGSDLIVALDECTDPLAPREYQEEALARTHRWLAQSIAAHQQFAPETRRRLGWTPALYGVVQGGRYEELRRESARFVGKQEVDAIAIGGSFDAGDIQSAVRWVVEELPESKPRHLLGIGEPEDIRAAVREGVDTFDCVQPTRLARHGISYGPNFTKINLRNARYREDSAPLDLTCRCMTCRSGFSRAYLAHLVREREMAAATYLTLHNLFALNRLLREERQRILSLGRSNDSAA